ncbi:MAG: DUF4422 domain-containing protein [Treponema sp.]|jgi:lipopolysaccharide biosynthesis glycosyltransferase|nr:DUF4422 domain-containing protein [Treponema sp.]
MSDIKIFVCHTAGKQSETLDGTVFYNIRGGAVFDKGKSETDMTGDNTGDTISEKNASFCELTVAYWAWKNIHADYYGLCHYRRFFSFSDKKFDEDIYGSIIRAYLSEKTKQEFNLDEKSVDTIKEKIEQYDFIVASPFNTRVVHKANIYKQYTEMPYLFSKDIDCMMDIVREKYPQFVPAMNKYFATHLFYHCNMFIMKRELFNDYCTWMFDILFEFERRTDLTGYNRDSLRTIGHLGERLLGVYYFYLQEQKKYRFGIFQKVLIQNTERMLKPVYYENTVPVVFAVNDWFIAYMSTVIQSIIENANPKRNYSFFVLHQNVTPFTIDQIKRQFAGLSNFSINFINTARYFEDYTLSLAARPELTVETYFRLVIPYVFSSYEKVIYLDSDTVCLTDIAELYDYDMGEKWIAAAKDILAWADYYKIPDIKQRKKRYEKLGIDQENYFLAGVLVFNIKQFNKNINFQELLTLAASRDWDYQDQDVLNVLCKDNVLFLPLAWDFEKSYDISYFPAAFREEYLKAERNPKIIHYAAGNKPWIWAEAPYSEYFWRYAVKTPFWGTIITRMIWWLKAPTLNNKRIRDILFPRDSPLGNAVRKMYKMYKLLIRR